MSVNVLEIGEMIGKLFPLKYACDWDNSGFQVNMHNSTGSVLVCLDVTPEIVQEAADTGCGMIVSHHPLLFRPVGRLDTDGYVGACVAALVKNGISLYSAHTSVDNAKNGLNDCLANMIGLENRRFLAEAVPGRFFKIAVTVPDAYETAIVEALHQAGAGELGNYRGCYYSVEGTGSFIPGEGADPFIGSEGRREIVREKSIQALVPQERLSGAICAVRQAHPYEEPAIDVFVLEGPDVSVAGSGMIGDLKEPAKVIDILETLKQVLPEAALRFRGNENDMVSRVAVCGGAGGDFIEEARRQGAQMYVTGEIKHNMYVETNMNLVEAGHYATEYCFCGLMAESLQKALIDVKYNVTVKVAEKMEAPYKYY